MRNFYILFLSLVFSLGFSQNTEIKLSATGALISDPYNYCPSEMLNLEVDDYASTTVGSSGTLPASTFNSIYNDTTGELPVPFGTGPITEKFSVPINLDFNFKFFNKTYTRVVVGSNGRLLFSNDARLDNLNDTSNFIDGTLLTPPVLLPSPQYNRVYKTGDLTREIKMAQIFAGFTKLRINPATGSYKYKKFDTGTNKGILITFQTVVAHNGSGLDYGSFTSRIILFDDGRVVLNVKDKTIASYNAILGMQNEDGDKEIIPGNPPNPIYNNGAWTSFGTDAFVIKTGDIRTPTYSWELDRGNDGTIDQTSVSRVFPNYSPVSDIEKLSVKITFLETPEVKTSQVIFKKIKTPIIQGVLHCSYEMSVTSATFDPTLRYTWYRVGSTAPLSTGQIFSIHRQGGTVGDYYVKVTKFDGSPICPGADESNRLRYDKQKFPALIANSYCVTDNSSTPSPTKSINLYTQFYPQYDPASGLEPYKIVFSTSSGIVLDPANYNLPANTPVNLQFAVTDFTGTSPCYTGALSLYYVGMPPTKTISLCASVTTYNLKLAFENTTYPITYIYNYTYVDNGSTADGSAIDVTRKVNVRTSAAGIVGCFTNTVVDFVLGATVTLPNVPMQERCAGSDTNANRFDFNLIKNTLDPVNQYDVKFYTKSTNQEILPVTSSPGTIPNLNTAGYFWTASNNADYVVYAKVIDRVDPSCFSISNDIILRVYTKPTLIVTSIPKSNCQDNSVFNLTQVASSLTNASSPINVTLEYYSTNGTLLSGSEITNYDANLSGQTPYVKVIYNATCSDIIPFNLTYLPKPLALTNQIPICAETTYTLQEFMNQVATNPAQYTFTDVSGGPLPEYFDLSGSTLPTVNFLMKDNTTGCVSDPQSVSFVKRTNSVLLVTETPYVLCDEDFDGKTEFNLQSKEFDFISPGSAATFEYFKDDLFNVKIENFTKYVNEIPFDQTVYVRITISGFCPSIGKIHLKANTPTKSTTLKDKYDICFDETLTINAGDENTIFVWSDGQSGQNATFTETGNYSVILKNGPDGCPYTHNFTISDENQPKIDVINQTNNSIEVIASGGTKPYRYYFNGILNPLGNILQNPTQSSYEIQVESATGCFGPPKTIYFIKINNAFTPNGDGINDTWKIENLDKMQEVSIVIINRNGTKVFESTNPSKSEWDGKSNGRELPTSSYWYVVSWFDAVTQKNEQRQGWILLKNRN